jgi:hypothetical protein
MLKVAADKLKLEHLVIEKGQFRQERDHPKIVLEVGVTHIAFMLFALLLLWKQT